MDVGRRAGGWGCQKQVLAAGNLEVARVDAQVCGVAVAAKIGSQVICVGPVAGVRGGELRDRLLQIRNALRRPDPAERFLDVGNRNRDVLRLDGNRHIERVDERNVIIGGVNIGPGERGAYKGFESSRRIGRRIVEAAAQRELHELERRVVVGKLTVEGVIPHHLSVGRLSARPGHGETALDVVIGGRDARRRLNGENILLGPGSLRHEGLGQRDRIRVAGIDCDQSAGRRQTGTGHLVNLAILEDPQATGDCHALVLGR